MQTHDDAMYVCGAELDGNSLYPLLGSPMNLPQLYKTKGLILITVHGPPSKSCVMTA